MANFAPKGEDHHFSAMLLFASLPEKGAGLPQKIPPCECIRVSTYVCVCVWGNTCAAKLMRTLSTEYLFICFGQALCFQCCSRTCRVVVKPPSVVTLTPPPPHAANPVRGRHFVGACSTIGCRDTLWAILYGGRIGIPWPCYRGHLGPSGPKLEKESENKFPGPLGAGAQKVESGVEKESKSIVVQLF